MTEHVERLTKGHGLMIAPSLSGGPPSGRIEETVAAVSKERLYFFSLVPDAASKNTNSSMFFIPSDLQICVRT